jgi:hypothetical protein
VKYPETDVALHIFFCSAISSAVGLEQDVNNKLIINIQIISIAFFILSRN